MTTGASVLREMESRVKVRKEGANRYRCNHPTRPGSDSNSFTFEIAPDGEHGMWYDHRDDTGGSLYELADMLEIERPQAQAQQTKRAYTGLLDYAEAHGCPMEIYEKAGWNETTHKDRPALAIPTQTGIRYRYLDGDPDQRPFHSPTNYESCWYGLARALTIASAGKLPLVLCNGEASVVAAQYRGVPATCVTGGGEREIPEALLLELDGRWGGKILIAQDCDAKGRAGANKQVKQLGNRASIVDLGLSNKGDLADFCMLHMDDAMPALQTYTYKYPGQVESQPPQIDITETIVTTDEMLTTVEGDLLDITDDPFAVMEVPLNLLHEQGGHAHVIAQGMCWVWAAASGDGKTISLSTLLWNYNRRGGHGIVISPEWMDAKARKMGYRLMQQAGGATYEDMLLHKLYTNQRRTGAANPAGRPLSNAMVTQSCERGLRSIRGLTGKNAYITKPGLSAEALVIHIQAAYKKIEQTYDKPPEAIWMDYAQLLFLAEEERRSRMPVDTAVELLKTAGNELGMALFVTSQLKKEASEIVRAGGKFNAGMMQWMSDQPANFILMATPARNDLGQPLISGRYQKPYLRGRIVKDNLRGPGERDFHIPWQPDQLRLLDVAHSTAKQPPLPEQIDIKF